jgi:hypothetical protein
LHASSNTQRDAAASDCESHLKSKSKRKSSSAKSERYEYPFAETQQCIIHHPILSQNKKIKNKTKISLQFCCWVLGIIILSFFHMDSAASVIV